MPMPNPMYYIGIMSGTSMDGVDVAIINTDNQLHTLHTHPMPEPLRHDLQQLSSAEQYSVNHIASLDIQLGELFASAALEAIAAAGLSSNDMLAIGSHGQTIRHHPQADDAIPQTFSWQIGCPSTIAERTGITTVADFRRRDIAAGGEGAPLVPFAHQVLFGHISEQAIAILNIGGIANISYWQHPHAPVTGFDTGPGNMLMDGLIQHITQGKQTFDPHGALAASGNINEALLQQLMQHPFIQKSPPKSTGREDFGSTMLRGIINTDIPDADKMATALAFTAHSIASSLAHLPEAPLHWIVCGGGTRNACLMNHLKKELSPAHVQTSDEYAIDAQAVEAISFAILAKTALTGEFNTLANVTGARHNVCGGHIIPGDNWCMLINRLIQKNI